MANILLNAYHRDMFRSVLAILTIAALLLCPLRCSATGSAEAGEVKTGCSCCQPTCKDQPAQPNDSSPDHDCECANCLCHGAVLEHATEILSTDVLPLSYARSLVVVAPATPAAVMTRWNDRSFDGISLSGRAVCILQQSLQI